jgi:hypothetical protein
VTIRGSAGGLDWTTGRAMAASGDTFTITLTGITAPIEWKPLLDDTTWALGPNYRVASQQTLDVYPHFGAKKGTVETLIDAATLNAISDLDMFIAELEARL